jgi:hypothetical protein
MGRDAYFNTGLERRFAFAVQYSSDVRFFGGVNITTEEDLKHEFYRHAWSADRDSNDILIALRSYLSDTGLVLPDFTAFSSNLEGTHKLRNWMHTRSDVYIERMGAKEYYAFELGCVIYHQLKYMPELTVKYEYL